MYVFSLLNYHQRHSCQLFCHYIIQAALFSAFKINFHTTSKTSTNNSFTISPAFNNSMVLVLQASSCLTIPNPMPHVLCFVMLPKIINFHIIHLLLHHHYTVYGYETKKLMVLVLYFCQSGQTSAGLACISSM